VTAILLFYTRAEIVWRLLLSAVVR